METTARRRSFIMQYRAEDFPLYLLSIAVPGILIWPILPHRFEQVLLVLALAYMACLFPLRHGAKFDRGVFRVVREGIARYPLMLARSWRTARDAVLPIAVLFLLALTAEYFLRPALAGTRWLAPFPWQWALWAPFLLITLFRVTILIAHLLRASVVREVLETSPQRKSIAKLPIQHHIFHAFITGMMGHLSLVAPCALFFMLTDPSCLREALLLAGFLLWSCIAIPLRKRRILVSPGIINNVLFYQNHSTDHQSQFYFTVFHGHHHDAIPSAVIGSGAETGFLENTDRGIAWLDFLNSIVVVQMKWASVIAFDMVVHQYIPGIFPFAKPNFQGLGHHVAHHYGSALPLGVVFQGFVERADVNNGYKPDNVVTRWFAGEVERREKLAPDAGTKFLALYDHGVVSKKASPSYEYGMTSSQHPPQDMPAFEES
jgi:hypothetical protein